MMLEDNDLGENLGVSEAINWLRVTAPSEPGRSDTGYPVDYQTIFSAKDKEERIKILKYLVLFVIPRRYRPWAIF